MTAVQIKKGIQYFIWFLLVLPVGTQVCFFLQNVSPGAGDIWGDVLVLVFFIGWVFAPYILLAIINKYTSHWLNQLILLATTAVVAGGGVFMLLETSRSTDAQTGLVYVFFPSYQFAVILMMVLVMGFVTIITDSLDARRKRKAVNSSH